MRGLIWVNAAAFAVYLAFALGLFVFDLYLLPNLGAFQPPPAQVGIAIEQGTDPEGLRRLALLLFEHVTAQSPDINALIRNSIFCTRAHLLGTLTLACINFAWLYRLRKQARIAGATD